MAVGSPKSKTVTEKVNPVILRLLGLEDVFDIDYDTYITLLKEILVKSQSLGTLKLADEEVALLKEELKRVKGQGKSGRFKVKTTKIPVKKPTARPKIKIDKLLLPPSKQKMATRMLPPIKKIQEDKEEPATQKLLGGTDLKKVLAQITSSLDSILAALLEQNRETRKNTEKERRDAENRRRSARESKLESGAKALVNLGKKILAPFQSIWDKIWNWIFYTFLGKAVINMLNWFSDPKNADKVKTLGRFLKDWWPALLAGVVLFTTPFGLFVRTIIGTVARFTLQLTEFAIPSLLRFTRGAGGLAGRLLTNPFVMGTAAVAGTAVLANEVTGQRKAASVQTENKARAQTGRGIGTQGVGGVGDMGPTTPYGLLQGVRSGGFIGRAYAGGGQVFHGLVTDKTGETVSGAGPDTQFFPLLGGDGGAVLQKGEVVLQKGARERIISETGVDPLAYNIGPNANKPKNVGGIQAARGGGEIGGSGVVSGNTVQDIVKFLYKLTGVDVSRPGTWRGSIGKGLPNYGQNFAQGAQGLLNQGQNYLKGDGLQKSVSNLMQSGTQFGARLYDQALKVGNSALSNLQSGGLQKKAAETLQGIQSLPKKAGVGIFDTFKKMGSSETYKKGSERMGQMQDKMITLGDKFISKLPDGPFKDMADKGLIPIPSGNATMMRNLTFAKALLGPLGRPFKILSNKEVDKMRQQTIERTMGNSGLIVDPKTGQVKMNWNQEDINKGARGGGAYTDDLGPRGAAFNSILGRFSATTKGKGNTLMSDDRYNFNRTVAEYADLAKKGLLKGSMSDATYFGASMLGRFAQDVGWLNQRALGSEIEIGKVDRSKIDPRTGRMKSAQQIAAEKAKLKTKSNQKLNKAQQIYGADTPVITKTKPPKREWYDPRGWFGKQGGGFIGEGTGLNLFGAGADRQMIFAQPGEYVLPVDTVMRLGGKQAVDRLVAATDSNSAAAKLGANKPNLTPPTPPASRAGAGGMMTLPPIMGGSTAIGGGAGGSGSKREIMAFSAATAIEERKMNAEIYGIGVAPPFK